MLAYNNTPHDSLPNGLSPREVHFSRAPRLFLHAEPEIDDAASSSIKAAMAAACAVGDDVLVHDVASYAKRQTKTSPTNYASRLQVGDLAIQKRTSFPAHIPRKLAFRVVIDAFEVTARVAINAFRVKSIITGNEQILVGDFLIKIRRMDQDALRALCQEMECVSTRNASRATGPPGQMATTTMQPSLPSSSNIRSWEQRKSLNCPTCLIFLTNAREFVVFVGRDFLVL